MRRVDSENIYLRVIGTLKKEMREIDVKGPATSFTRSKNGTTVESFLHSAHSRDFLFR